MSFEFFKKPDIEQDPNDKKETMGLSDFSRRIKKALVGILIVTNFIPNEVKAGDNPFLSKDKELNKTEKGYKSNIVESKDRIEFQATNFFEPDSDVFKPESIKAILGKFQELLEKINSENYEQIIKEGIVVSPGADPNHSVKFKNNEELAKARAEALIILLKSYLDKNNLSNLSDTQKQKLKDNINFIIEIPVSATVINPEIGVIYPQDLGYKEGDLAKMTKVEIAQVFEQCRVVSVSLGLNISSQEDNIYYTSANDFLTPMELKGNSQDENNIELVKKNVNWNAKSIMINVDNSPSINKKDKNQDLSWQVILQKITKDPTLDDKNISFAFFSDSLNEIENYVGISKVIDRVEGGGYKGASKEKAVLCALHSIENFPDNKDSKIFKTFTDEALQDVSVKMVMDFENICSNKNINAKIYFINKNKKLMELSVWEIKKLVEKAVFDGIKSQFKSFILNRKSYYDRHLPKKEKMEANFKLDKLIKDFTDCNFEEFFNNSLIEEMYEKSNEIKKNPLSYFSNEIMPVVPLEGYGRVIDLD